MAQSIYFPPFFCNFQILTAGWDELECHRVFNFLSELSNLPRKVQTVVSSKPGNHQSRQRSYKIKLHCHGEGTKWSLITANKMHLDLRTF